MELDQLLAEWGAPLDCGTLEEPLANLMALPLDRARHALKHAHYEADGGLHVMQTEVLLLDNADLNAFAAQLDRSSYVVGFCGGMFGSLLEACLNFSTRLDPAKALPIHQGEKVLVYPEKLKLMEVFGQKETSPYGETFHRRLITVAEVTRPNTEMAIFLFELASWFIAMHEVMHLVLGHAGYLKRKVQWVAMAEFSDIREKILSYEFSQMLEYSADRHAFRGVARRLLEGDIDCRYEEGLLSGLEIDRATFFTRSLVTAVTLLFHLFPRRFCSIDRIFGCHPHPYTRMQWMIMELGHETSEELEFRDAILLPMAEACATLKANFDAPDNWWAYSERDGQGGSSADFKPSDKAYAKMQAMAREWSHKIMPHGPIYPASAHV